MKALFPVLLLAAAVNIAAIATSNLMLLATSIVLFAVYFAAKAVIQSREKKE